MPPMITTTSELSSQLESTPGARLANEPPITPPSPASAEPTKNAIANVSWMLMPRALTICRSSTPARITIPVRVFLSQTHRPSPTAIATARMKSRVVVYWTPATWRFQKASSLPGHAMSSATPPKCASIWSARMIAIAIVISAWRSSCPWFQRRKTCCIDRPTSPTRSEATIAGRIQFLRSTWELVSPNAEPSPTQWRCSFSAM